MTRPAGRLAGGLLLALLATAGHAQQAAGPQPAKVSAEAARAALVALAPPTTADTPPASTRNGRDIYTRFRDGLADPDCGAEASTPLQAHFANAPRQLASRDSDALALFGYVVDALREADLPTEYALIPFVESGFKPGARSAAGPAGLWQFIAMTARNHEVPMRAGYDGRLSAVDSTRAAVRYLKTLHGMFAGDWRLAVMAFNAGEYRVFGALKRSGQRADDARPAELLGLSDVTQGYVRKLHALSCVLDRADDREDWLRALDRPVTALVPTALPAGVDSLDAWAKQQGLDAARLKRLNPALPDGRLAAAPGVQILAPPTRNSNAGAIAAAPARVDPASAQPALAERVVDALIPTAAASPTSPALDAANADRAARTHTVARGDSVWRLARRYGVRHADLLSRNRLTANSVLRPGTVLRIDSAP